MSTKELSIQHSLPAMATISHKLAIQSSHSASKTLILPWDTSVNLETGYWQMIQPPRPTHLTQSFLVIKQLPIWCFLASISLTWLSPMTNPSLCTPPVSLTLPPTTSSHLRLIKYHWPTSSLPIGIVQLALQHISSKTMSIQPTMIV